MRPNVALGVADWVLRTPAQIPNPWVGRVEHFPIDPPVGRLRARGKRIEHDTSQTIKLKKYRSQPDSLHGWSIHPLSSELQVNAEGAPTLDANHLSLWF